MKNLFILFLTTLASVSMMAEVSVSDKTVLLKLYTATNGANWNTEWIYLLYLLGMVLN
jgi:hypothetical protein